MAENNYLRKIKGKGGGTLLLKKKKKQRVRKKEAQPGKATEISKEQKNLKNHKRIKATIELKKGTSKTISQSTNSTSLRMLNKKQRNSKTQTNNNNNERQQHLKRRKSKSLLTGNRNA